MFVMIKNRIIEAIKKDGRKLTLSDGTVHDITEARYIWQNKKPYPNPYYLNAYIMREMFRQLQYKETK